MTPTPRCLSCGYVLWGLPAGRCPECGREFDPQDPSTFSTKPLFVRWKFWLPGFLLALGSGLVLFVLLILLAGWGVAVSLAAPVAVGCTIGYGCRANKWGHVMLCLVAVVAIVCGLFSLSLVGIFCGAVLACVLLIPTLVGMAMGVYLRQRLKRSNFEQRWYLPMLMLAIVLLFGGWERITHRPFAIETVVTSVEMSVSADHAWNAIQFYDEVRHRPPLLLRLGLPRPLYTRGSISRLGDTRTCVYTKGHLTKRVTQCDPRRRLAFDVIEQDRIEIHSVRLTDGSFDLTTLEPNKTRVSLTTRYEPKLGPRWIWRPAELLAVHTMHRHVLEGMRLKATEDQSDPAR